MMAQKKLLNKILMLKNSNIVCVTLKLRKHKRVNMILSLFFINLF